MNYLAHGHRHLHDPWAVAGTALPDWLRILDRRARLHAADVRPLADHADPRVAALARGVLAHHDDDRRFHGSEAFAAARREVAAHLRAVLPADAGHRPWFVAHILLEAHLDASLAAADGTLRRYYAALGSLEPADVADAARLLSPRTPEGLDRLVRGFVRERFLADYDDPESLRHRLNQVMRRARQPALPGRLAEALAATRAAVAARREGLLARP